MKVLQWLVDNSTTILGLLTAVFGLLSAFGLSLTSEQVGAVMTVAGAVIAVLSSIVTTAKRKVLTLAPNGASGPVLAGPAAAEPTGTPVPTALNEGGELVAFATVNQAA